MSFTVFVCTPTLITRMKTENTKKKAKIPQSFLKVKKVPKSVLNGTKIWLISNILKEKQGLQCRKFSNVTIIAKLQSVLLRWYFHTGEPQTNKWHYLSKEFLEIIISHVFFGIHLSASLNIAKILIFISESQREIKKSFQLVTKIISTRKVQLLKSLMKLSIDKKKIFPAWKAPSSWFPQRLYSWKECQFCILQIIIMIIENICQLTSDKHS